MPRAKGPVRACAALHAHVFARAVLPIFVAAALVFAVVLGGHGVDPRDIVRIARSSAVVRVAAPLVWAALVRSSARQLLAPPGSTWVRSAPIARAATISISASFILLAQLPLTSVWIAGGGTAEGVALAFVAATWACAPRDRFGLVATIAALVVVWASPWLRLGGDAISAIVFAWIVRHAWTIAVVRARGGGLRLRGAPAFVQIVFAQGRVLVRERPVAVARAFGVAALGSMLAHRTLRGDASGGRVPLAQLGAIVAVLGGSPLLASVGRTRRTIGRWLRATATPRQVGLLAAALVVATPALAFAGSTAPPIAEVAPSHVVLCAALSLAVALVLVRLEGWLHARRRDAGVIVVLASLGVAVAFVGLAALPTWMVVLSLVACAAFGLARESKSEVGRAEDA